MNLKKLWNNNSIVLIVTVLLLIAIGTINVQSSSMVTAYYQGTSLSHFLIRQLVIFLLGIICASFFAKYNYQKLTTRKSMILISVITIFLLIIVLFIGTVVNGSRRWIPLVVFQFQPAELAKLSAIIVTAYYLKITNKLKKRPSLIQRYYLIVVIMAGLTELEPDMGTAAIIIGIPFIIYVISGISKKQIYCISGLGILGIAYLCIAQTYRLQRLMAWYDPWPYAQNVGYQITQSLKAIGSGGITGMGLGQGISKYAYLPESHTDFAFAIISQEGGFIAACGVILLFVLLGITIAKIAYNSVTITGRVLSLGILFLVVGQALANMMMVIGILPVIGVPLPFISYGGTSLVVNMIAIGILINIDRHNRLISMKKKNETKNNTNNRKFNKPHLVRLK